MDSLGEWFNWLWYQTLWPLGGNPIVMLVLLVYWRWADRRAMQRQDDAHRAEMASLHKLYREQLKTQHGEFLTVYRNWLDDAG